MSNANSEQHLLLDWDNKDRGKGKLSEQILSQYWRFVNKYLLTVIPREPLGLYRVHIAQLMTHPAIYTIPFTLRLFYKPLGILQRVTKSQKVHISNNDGLEKLHNINFVWQRSQGFPERKHNSRNVSLPQSRFLRTVDLLLFKQFFRSIILWLPFIHYLNICRETWFFMIEAMGEVNQPLNWLRNIISSFT